MNSTGCRVAVTGAAGFVGRWLCGSLREEGICVRSIYRDRPCENAHQFCVGNIGPETDWSLALTGIDTVVHLAAVAHIPAGNTRDAEKLMYPTNVLGTDRLAREAVRLGVRRLIFLSTVGVFGENTEDREPFGVLDEVNPKGPYSISKLEAEKRLWEISAKHGLEVTILRAPLVYGPDAPGNFSRLLALVRRGVPLPFGSVRNLRSFVSIGNLANLIHRCITDIRAAGRTFLVSDDEDVSTRALICQLALVLDRPARLVPVPVRWLRLAAKGVRRSSFVDKLVSSFQVDISETKQVLGWYPPGTIEEELRRAVVIPSSGHSHHGN